MNKELEAKIDEILTRGVEKIYPSKEEFKKVLMSGKKIKLYCGYDPTAKALHIGNAISINKLSQFQKLGHEVVFLIGDFTGMIGDPTDKSAARKKLTREEALKNSENYKNQASAYLKFDGENPAVIKYNSEWSDKLTFKDLIKLASNFTVQQMLKRSMFRRRMTLAECEHCHSQFQSPIQFSDEESLKSSKLTNNLTSCPNCKKITSLNNKDLKLIESDVPRESPIYLHEFLYPLAQGYDSVAMDVDLEVGGNDQTFNMLCGRDLMKVMKDKEKFVVTMKLLADEKGKKMGKTEGNVVNLDETPENMFGQIMAWSDGLIEPGFELCTNLPAEETAEISEKLKNPENNPRDLKLKLAFEITKINHGEEKAIAAQKYFVDTFSKREVPTDVEVVPSPAPEISILDYMIEAGLAKSKSDARRKIEQGGVSIEGNKTLEMVVTNRILNEDDDGKVLKVGKFHFVKIKFSK